MKFRTLVAALIATSLTTGPALADDPKSYDYGEKGPEVWGQLYPDFALCEKGDMQTPIDLGKAANAKGNVALSISYESGPLTVQNKGLTVQADFAPGSSINSAGMVFNLIQVHFHTPSEHAIDGKRFPMVGHFVHATENGQLGVLGVMFEEGVANAELAKILAATPSEKSKPKTVEGQSLDPNGLLPADRAIYRYMGSLTTPPCSEGVNWHVLSNPITASASQIAQFESLMGDNSRPLRAANNRLVVAPQ